MVDAPQAPEVGAEERFAAAKAWLGVNGGSKVIPPTDYISGWFMSHYGKALDSALCAAAEVRSRAAAILRSNPGSRDCTSGGDGDLAELRAENDKLRAALSNGSGPCVYCNLPRERWAECQHGFPGCDRADDAMLCPHVGAELETTVKLRAAEAERDALAARLVEAERRGAEAMRERCAKVADEYAAENLRMAMDSIHLDPALSRGDFSPAAQRVTDQMQAHGAHHAGAYAGCGDLAAAIRSLRAKESRP